MTERDDEVVEAPNPLRQEGRKRIMRDAAWHAAGVLVRRYPRAALVTAGAAISKAGREAAAGLYGAVRRSFGGRKTEPIEEDPVAMPPRKPPPVVRRRPTKPRRAAARPENVLTSHAACRDALLESLTVEERSALAELAEQVEAKKAAHDDREADAKPS